jgi:DNA helicase HerA-like ATPase
LSKEEKGILNFAFSEAGKVNNNKENVFDEAIRNYGTSGKLPTSLDWDEILRELLVVINNSQEGFTNQSIFKTVENYQKQYENLGKISVDSLKNELRARLKAEVIKDLKSKFNEIEIPQRILTFAEQVKKGDYRLESLKLINNISKPGIYRLDLSSIDDADIRRAVCGDLMRETFEKSKEQNGNFRTLFIVDEAQNYAPEKASKNMPSFRWMKVIASEGRKFGVALLVMTQRPAYLSKDILSQCNTQAIFRLVNQADIQQVEQSVEGISEYDLMQLPNFVAGQAIFTGVGMKMPVRVKVV